MKRLLVLILTLSLLTACGIQQNEKSPTKEIKEGKARPTYEISTYYDLHSKGQEIFDYLSDRYQSSAKVTEHDDTDLATYIDLLNNSFLVTDAPDIVLGRPELQMKELIEKGYIHEITDRVAKNYMLNSDISSQSVMEALKINGKYYGLPRSLVDYSYYLNEFLLDEMEVEFSSDWTVDEFIDYCFEVKERYPNVYMLPEAYFASESTGMLKIDIGGLGQVLIDQLVVSDMDYFLSNEESSFNSDLFIERLKKVKRLLTEKYCKPLTEKMNIQQISINKEYLEDVLILPLVNEGYGDELYYFDNQRFAGINIPFGTYTGHRIFSGDYNFVTSTAIDTQVAEDMLISYVMGYRSQYTMNYLNTGKAISTVQEVAMYVTGVDPKFALKHFNENEQLSQKGNHFLWITPPVTIIREACKNMIINDISPEKTAEEIQNKINLYLLENK
jgi:ABC-type glycerol-3-phosphate transport system substrate-binding protein